MKLLLVLFCFLITLPGFTQEDDAVDVTSNDEKAIEDLEVSKRAQALNHAPVGILEDLKKDASKIDLKALLDPKTMEILKQTIKNGRIQDLPPTQIRAMILDQVKGRPMEKVFEKFPKLLDITVDIVRDPNAFNGLLDILPRVDDLTFFGYCSIGLLLLGFLLKRFFVRKNASFSKRFLVSILIHTIVTLSAFGLFYSMFQKQISPTLKVISRHL